MDRRTFSAIFLCLIIYIGWQELFLKPQIKQNQSQAPAPTRVADQSNPNPSNQTPFQQISPNSAESKRPAEKLSLSTETGDALVGDEGQFLLDWTLKDYRLGISDQTPAVDLTSVTHQKGEVTLAFDDPSFMYLNTVQGNLSKVPTGALWKYEDSNVKLTREFKTLSNQPYLDIQVKAEFKTKLPKYAFLSIAGVSPEKDPEAQDRQLLYWTNQSVERVQLKDNVAQKEIPTPVKYIAATNRYFTLALVAQESLAPHALIQPMGQGAARISMAYPLQGNTLSIPVRVYFGPKELNLLRKVDPSLDHAVDLGWFTLFAYPLLKTLKWLYEYLHNYGVAIIILTILLKVATFPLTYKSMKSMKKMAKLQPQLQKLRDRYKDDKEALNREMLTLMRNHGYNPAAGCLPIVIQMPVFIALYRVLYSSIELYHAPFLFWIKDLSVHDPYYVTPVLLSLTMFVQQKLTPNTATDPAQAKMMQLMPLIFGAMMFLLPSGLTLYMLTNAIASIIQQVILNKKLEPAH